MGSDNQRRRIRRKATNKKNEIQSKNQVKLDQKDQMLLQNSEGIRNQAITNANKLNQLEVNITSINRNLQKFEKSIQQFEEEEINPQLANLNNRLDEVCYLLFDMADALAFDIEDERYDKLGFEINDDNSNTIDDTDDTEVEVLEDEITEEVLDAD